MGLSRGLYPKSDEPLDGLVDPARRVEVELVVLGVRAVQAGVVQEDVPITSWYPSGERSRFSKTFLRHYVLRGVHVR